MSHDRISPDEVLFLRTLRQFVGGSMHPQTGRQGTPISPRKSSLGRVIDVRWTLPVVNQNGLPVKEIIGAQKFGRVEWMPDEPQQLDEEDWLVTAQPLNVLEYEGAMPRVFGSTTGVAPFLRRTIGVNELNPACWWPYDNSDGSGVTCASDVAGSPFWLVVTGGPEEGALQRVPIPIFGTCVSVRGRNVGASIEYNPGFAAPGVVVTPLEQPVLLEGAGKILVTVTKAQPVARWDATQLRVVDIRTSGSTIPSGAVTWVPKFARRMQPISGFEAGTSFEFLDQGGHSVEAGAFYERNTTVAVPQNAVALRAAAGDERRPIGVTFEVFS